MMYFTIGAAVGVLIGWNLPQPQYAKNLQDKIVAKVKAKFAKKD